MATPTSRQVTRAFTVGVLLLLCAAGGWVFIDAHRPTVSNALTSSWVLKPRAYDLLRFACAALAILGGASLLRALLIALQFSSASSAPPAEASPAAAERSPVLRSLGFMALGAALTAVVGIVSVLQTGGDPLSTSARPSAAAQEADVVEQPAGDSSSGSAYIDDRAAKATVRNAVSAMEACYTDAQNYERCDTPDELPDLQATVAIAREPAAGEITLYGNGDEFSITAADSDGYLWSITKDGATGTIERTCLVDGGFTPCDPATW